MGGVINYICGRTTTSFLIYAKNFYFQIILGKFSSSLINVPSIILTWSTTLFAAPHSNSKIWAMGLRVGGIIRAFTITPHISRKFVGNFLASKNVFFEKLRAKRAWVTLTQSRTKWDIGIESPQSSQCCKNETLGTPGCSGCFLGTPMRHFVWFSTFPIFTFYWITLLRRSLANIFGR